MRFPHSGRGGAGEGAPPLGASDAVAERLTVTGVGRVGTRATAGSWLGRETSRHALSVPRRSAEIAASADRLLLRTMRGACLGGGCGGALLRIDGHHRCLSKKGETLFLQHPSVIGTRDFFGVVALLVCQEPGGALLATLPANLLVVLDDRLRAFFWRRGHVRAAAIAKFLGAGCMGLLNLGGAADEAHGDDETCNDVHGV